MTSDPNSPEVIASQLSEPEATAMIAYLCERGFEARPCGSNAEAVDATFVPGESVQIVVKQSDAERARQAVAEFRRK
jgi:hypothetical protein